MLYVNTVKWVDWVDVKNLHIHRQRSKGILTGIQKQKAN